MEKYINVHVCYQKVVETWVSFCKQTQCDTWNEKCLKIGPETAMIPTRIA